MPREIQELSVCTRTRADPIWKIYQDTEYHNEREASGESMSYSYTSLDEPITNLFSRTVYIQVTNKKTEVSFVKIDNDTVVLDSNDYLTSATALYGAEFIAYPVDDSGEQIADSNTYTVTSDSDGVVTFSGLPLGQKYKIQEADSPTGYTISSWYWLVTISESGAVTSFDEAVAKSIQRNMGKSLWVYKPIFLLHKSVVCRAS